MKKFNIGVNPYRNAIIAFSVSVVLFSIIIAMLGPESTWRLWNVPAMTPHFADLRTITGGAESYALGLDPMIKNPGDPWGRTMNYPRIWQSLYYFNIDQTHTTAFGLILVFLFFVGVVLVLPCASIPILFMVLAAVFSPATLLGIERGNIDLLIFFLVAVSVFFAARIRLFSFLLLLAAFSLKLYPIFGFAVFSRERKHVATTYFGALALILLVYVSFYYSDLILISSGTPRSTSLSYGLNVFWMRVASFNAGFGFVARACSYMAVLAVIAISLDSFLKKKHIIRDERSNGIFLDAFRAGAAIYAGTFLLGNNWDYRLMFLIFTIPQLFYWFSRRGSPLKIISELTLVTIFLSLWYLVWKNFVELMPYGHPASYIIDEISNWVTFGGLMYLLLNSMPSWISEDMERGINYVRSKIIRTELPSNFE